MTEINEKINYKEKQIQSHNNKSDSTKAEYLTTAEGFLKRELDDKGIIRTAGNICIALKAWSKIVKPNTYRKMQCSLEYQQYSNRFYKAAEQIRNTQRIGYGEISGKKKKICKSISEGEHFKLLKAAMQNGNEQLISILTVSYYMGIRPIEAPSLEYEDLGKFLIVNVVGAKKNEKGTRGIDRELYLELESNAKYAVIHAIDTLQGLDKKQIAALRKRVCRLSQKIFPGRKSPFGLYVYRHQLASYLRVSKSLSDREKSGVLGHLSLKSFSQYGHFNSAGGLKRNLPIASEETIERVMDDMERTNYMDDLNSIAEISTDVDNEMIDHELPIDSEKSELMQSSQDKSLKKVKRRRHRIELEYTPF